jgi:hypothetical protein
VIEDGTTTNASSGDRAAAGPRRPSTTSSPVSQGGAFFDASNLQASCGNCNFSHGAYLTRDNRRAIIEQNEYLERVVHAQQERIIELEDQLARHLKGPEHELARTRAKPAIR